MPAVGSRGSASQADGPGAAILSNAGARFLAWWKRCPCTTGTVTRPSLALSFCWRLASCASFCVKQRGALLVPAARDLPLIAVLIKGIISHMPPDQFVFSRISARWVAYQQMLIWSSSTFLFPSSEQRALGRNLFVTASMFLQQVPHSIFMLHKTSSYTQFFFIGSMIFSPTRAVPANPIPLKIVLRNLLLFFFFLTIPPSLS